MKKTTKIVLENKFVNIDESDIRLVNKTLLNRQLAGTAEVVEEYEQKLSSYFGAKYALAVSSGTAALHLLLYLYDVKSGDEVIVPPTAPIMSALPILAMRAIPVFVDVNADNFGFDINDLKRKITLKTKAIVTVPMWGYPVRMGELRKIAKEKGIPLIEDASHCHGAKIKDRFVGTMSDVSFFSTQERKLIATGEGAFILTNNKHISDRIQELRNFGKPVATSGKMKKYLGQYGYLFGLNFRLSALSAALGISQLGKLDDKIKMRTKNSDKLKISLLNQNWLREIEYDNDCIPNYYSMVMFVEDNRDAYEVAKTLSLKDIISDTYRFGIKPLYRLSLFKKYKSACPNSEKILKKIITLPTHEGLTSVDLNYIIKEVIKLT